MAGLRECVLDRSPYEAAVKQNIRAVRRMYERAIGFDRVLGIDDVRRRRVVDFD